jgi:hypothetical protein
MNEAIACKKNRSKREAYGHQTFKKRTILYPVRSHTNKPKISIKNRAKRRANGER